MAWLYAAAWADSNSDCDLPSETPIAPFVMSNGKPSARSLSWRGWKTRPWIERLYGTILKPLTEKSGVDSWILSLRGCRASHSALRANDGEPMTKDTSGLKYGESSRNVGPHSFLSRMFPASYQHELFSIGPRWSPTSTRWTLPLKAKWIRGSVGTLAITENGYTGDFSERSVSPHCSMSAANWKNLVSAWRREYFRRLKSARRTGGRGSSCWPTVQAFNERGDRMQYCQQGKGGLDLKSASEHWPSDWQTPASDSFRSRGGDRVDEQGLDQQARLWGTPRVTTNAGIGCPEHTRKGNRLEDQACLHSLPDPAISMPGQKSCGSTRRLNPRFATYLMGLPIGWTSVEPLSCAPWGTPWFQWWLHTHSSLLQSVLRGSGIDTCNHDAQDRERGEGEGGGG